MHLNYHFFKFLSPALNQEFRGKQILSCFSQGKNELLIEVESGPWIRIYIETPRVYLSFPTEFKRAKNHTVNFFPSLLGKSISKVSPSQFDRSFYLETADGQQLLFKMHGNRSNCILYDGISDEPKDIFLRRAKDDWKLYKGSLNRQLELSREKFEELEGNASKFIPTLGKIPREWLKKRDYPQVNIDQKWELIQGLFDFLDTPLFSILKIGDDYAFTLLPVEDSASVVYQSDHPIEACNELYYFGVVKSGFQREKAKLISEHLSEIKRARSFVNKVETKLEELKSSPPPSELADVIMANLHSFQNGQAKIQNFYSGEEVLVKLNNNQTPQAYAEKLYRKSKNRKLEWEELEKNLTTKQEQIQRLEKNLNLIEEVDTYRNLKKFIKERESALEKKGSENAVPYKSFEYQGKQIWVGKSAKANDELIRSYGKKNDLWLHARDVSGSHVLIKEGKNSVTKSDLLEVAASLAAYYSKSKSQSMAPVIYTELKFVRKVKGSPPGAVVVDKEKVIMVEPRSPESLFNSKA